MPLYTAGSEKLYLVDSGSWYLLTKHDFPDKTSHNDLQMLESRSPGFLVLLSGTEPVPVLVFAASHSYAHYAMAEKRNFWRFSA